jgi:hypothetical protein
MKKRGQLTTLWLEARELIKENKISQLEETLEKGILVLAINTMNGVGDKELMEGVKKETWYERFWITMENHVWPTFPDYEENWKCS